MKMYLGAIAAIGIGTLATTAFATNILGEIHLIYPAANCATGSTTGVLSQPGMTINGTRLVNSASTTQEVWCPIFNDAQSVQLLSGYVNVSPGWATLSSCQLVVANPDGGAFWIIAPTSIQHPSSSRDNVQWNVNAMIDHASAVLQCAVPAGKEVRDYYFNNDFILWSSFTF